MLEMSWSWLTMGSCQGRDHPFPEGNVKGSQSLREFEAKDKGTTDGQKALEKMFNISNCERNANQNYNEVSPHTCQYGHYPTFFQQTIHAREGVEGKEPSYTAVGKVN